MGEYSRLGGDRPKKRPRNRCFASEDRPRSFRAKIRPSFPGVRENERDGTGNSYQFIQISGTGNGTRGGCALFAACSLRGAVSIARERRASWKLASLAERGLTSHRRDLRSARNIFSFIFALVTPSSALESVPSLPVKSPRTERWLRHPRRETETGTAR